MRSSKSSPIRNIAMVLIILFLGGAMVTSGILYDLIANLKGCH